MTITEVPEWNAIFNLLLDPAVSEIEANGPNNFFMKRAGQRIKIENISLPSEEAYINGIEKGLVPFVRSMNAFDRHGYLFEGRLNFSSNGTDVSGRCHIVLPPTCDYAQVTIAKKTASLKTIDSIAAMGSMSTEMMEFLNMAVKANLTIVFSGGTGAGKTTMLEALAKNIPSSLRIGVAEDTPELILSQPNVSYLHSVPWQPGMDSNEVATLSWVVQQFQRMRTDKLIIGETRGKEFADFLIAANSGMEGSMTTIHADDPTRCLMKMTNFAMKGSERQPVRAINNDIANAVDIIVQLVIVNGKHRVSHIQEIVPTLGNTEEAKITTAPLYRWDRSKDMFYKDNVMTDNLRERIVNNGVNIDQFLASTREVRHPAHGAGKNLPTNTQGRTLPRSLPTSPIPGKRSL